jgi:hypothetical protein
VNEHPLYAGLSTAGLFAHEPLRNAGGFQSVRRSSRGIGVIDCTRARTTTGSPDGTHLYEHGPTPRPPSRLGHARLQLRARKTSPSRARHWLEEFHVDGSA